MTRLWALVPVVLLALTVAGQKPPRQATISQTPPNVLVVLTDGQDVDSVSEMLNARSKLADRGTTFINRTLATTPYAARAGPTEGPHWPRDEAERPPSQLKNLTCCGGADCSTADSNAFR